MADRYKLIEEHSECTRRCLNNKMRDIHKDVIGFFRYRVDMGCTVMNEKDAEWMTRFVKATKVLDDLFDERFGDVVEIEKD